MKPSLSIVIPALNEERALGSTVATLIDLFSGLFDDYEVLIIDDGSRDRTGAIADQLASANRRVRVIHHGTNLGLGYSYREGIRLATMEYVCWLAADRGGLTSDDDLRRIFAAVGQADMVLVYLLSENRTWRRQVISRTYTKLLNLLFGLKLKYYNGGNVYRRELLAQIPMRSNGYGLFAEILVQLVKSGRSYVEVGMHNRELARGNSNAFRLRNCFRVGRLLVALFWRIRLLPPLRGLRNRLRLNRLASFSL